MKKGLALLLGTLFLAGMLGGCGSETAVLSEMKTERYVIPGAYEGIEVSVPARIEVTEEMKTNYINYILQSSAQWVGAEEGAVAKMGDIARIDYEGRIDGELFQGGADQGFDLQLGSHTFIEGFEEGVVGMGIGETKDISIRFPDPYQPNPDLSGTPVVFTVTLNGIQTQQVPELTDEFVKTLDVGCETVAEYETYVQGLLEQEMDNTYTRNVEDVLVNRLLEGSEFKKDPPKEMVDQYYDRVIRNVTRIAATANMSLEVYVSRQGMEMEKFKEEAREGAVASCRESIMLQAIANAEKITVSQEEVDSVLTEEAAERGYESVEALKEDLALDHYEDYVMCDKVMEFLREHAVITEY